MSETTGNCPLAEKLSRLFSLSSNPVLGIREGRVQFSNFSATELYGRQVTGLQASELVDDHILAEDAESFVSSALVMGQQAAVSATRFDDLLVLVLGTGENAAPPKSLAPASLISSLRSSSFNLKLAADQITARLDTLEDPKLVSYAGMLYHNYYNMLRLTINLDTANRLLDGSLSFTPRLRDMAGLCRDLVGSVNALLTDSEVELLFHCDEKRVFANVDGEKIEQLLLNLLSNSMIHCKPGCKINVAVKSTGGRIILSVDDNGCGMNPEVLSTVFNRFEQQLGLADIASGAGLGLSIAKGIAQLHGGALIIESRKDKGTSVRVMLPANTASSGTLHDTELPPGGMELLFRELSGVLDSRTYSERKLMD